MFILIILLIITPIQLASQNAFQIIKKSEDLKKKKTSHGIIEMKVITPDYTRKVKMEAWWVGNEKALIITRYPRKEAGNKTLKVKNEIWLYLKNTETTIKIPPSMMLQSWNGSDFTYDDLVRESNLTRDYTMKIISEDTINDVKCWKIELKPKPEATVVWGKLIYWVRKKDNLPAKIEYYDENDNLVRYLVFSEIKNMHGRKIPTLWVMYNNVEKGRKTVFKIVDVKFDIKISDRIFSLRELERRR